MKQFAEFKDAVDEGQLKAAQLASGRVEMASRMTVSDTDLLREIRRIAGETPPLTALEEWQKGRKLCKGSFLPACEAWAETKTGKYEGVTVEESAIHTRPPLQNVC